MPDDLNIQIYKHAVSYLASIIPPRVKDINRYFIGDRRDFSTLRDVYIQFIMSAQNYQRMPNVIKFKEREGELAKILFDYDFMQIKDIDPEELYQVLRKKYDSKGKDGKMNSWHKWSKSVVDSAKFMEDFKDADDFREFVRRFDYNVSTRMALPLLISKKVSGIGFALACDMLKELGFTNYPKPDVHMIKVFSSFGLAEKSDISTFEAIVRMSDKCRETDPTATPYKVDKVFWLICSGRFYLETPEVDVGSHKDAFIKKTKVALRL